MLILACSLQHGMHTSSRVLYLGISGRSAAGAMERQHVGWECKLRLYRQSHLEQ